MYCSALLNSLNWMNCVAGTLPCALGEQGEVPAFWQPASGSGNTRPRAEYWPSSVATGDAPAAGTNSAASTKTAAAKASRRVTVVLPSRRKIEVPCVMRERIFPAEADARAGRAADR